MRLRVTSEFLKLSVAQCDLAGSKIVLDDLNHASDDLCELGGGAFVCPVVAGDFETEPRCGSPVPPQESHEAR